MCRWLNEELVFSSQSECTAARFGDARVRLVHEPMSKQLASCVMVRRNAVARPRQYDAMVRIGYTAKSAVGRVHENALVNMLGTIALRWLPSFVR